MSEVSGVLLLRESDENDRLCMWISIVTALIVITKVHGAKILVEFVNGPNCINRTKMTAILNT